MMDCGENPHDFTLLTRWCARCGLTEMQLAKSACVSILWQECYLGVVGDYNELTTGHWYEERRASE